MMQEEDCLDLSPTPDSMAGVDVSLGEVETVGPTLLMAAPSSYFSTPECSEDRKQEILSSTREGLEVLGGTSEAVGEKSNGCSNGNEVVGAKTTLMEEAKADELENSDSSRVKELFGSPSDGEAFGSFDAKPVAPSTASVLFGNGGDSNNSSLFDMNKASDSFTHSISTTVGESSKCAEDKTQVEQRNFNSLTNSFQGLGIENQKTVSPPLISSQSVPYLQSNITELADPYQSTENQVFQSPITSIQAPLGTISLDPSMSVGSSAQHSVESQLSHAPQNQIPMYNVMNNQQLQQQQTQNFDSTNIPSYNPQDSLKFQNGANVGNSYMYTSPISSVIPGYEPSHGSEISQKQTGTRLHQSHVPKQAAMPAGELFVPDLYGHSTAQPSNQINIFTPTPDMNAQAQNVPNSAPQMDYGTQNVPPQSNYITQNQYTAATMVPYNTLDYPQYEHQANFYPGDAQDPGFWEWVKNQHWGEGAQKLGKQLLQKTKYTIKWVGSTVIDHASKVNLSKDATDTVLTTLDPGMEEYLNPSVHLAVASQDSKILQAVRQGFKQLFGHTAAKGHFAPTSLPKLPIGFDLAGKAVAEQLDTVSKIDFHFSQPYVHVALQPFLTELQQGSWSCMFCIALRDCTRQLQLQAYSQPISIPPACISIAYSRTSQENMSYGFDVSIDEAVRLFKPYSGEDDWSSVLNGIKLETIISLAAQGLASDYRRELENPTLTQNDSFVVLPS